MEDFSKIRGFNYQPGYAINSLDAWMNFDSNAIFHELENGKKLFPKINTIRIWLSFDAYNQDPEKFMKQFETYLQILDRLKLKAIPCIFNCWHSNHQDNGGVYIQQLIGIADPSMNPVYDAFAERIVDKYKDDERIVLWDMCNEPFSYQWTDLTRVFLKYELEWLKGLYDCIKRHHPAAPVSIGTHMSHGIYFYDNIEELCDVYTIHAYYNEVYDSYESYRNDIRTYVDRAAKHGKQCFATEGCWGSLDDVERAKQVKDTLDVFKELNMGFILHALSYSKVPDLHNAEDGPVGPPGNLCFINKDGSLRQGHDIVNQYC